jgi:hypothetical protein
MEYYLAVRMRRLARTYGTEPSQLRRVEPAPVRANGTNGATPYPGQAVAAGGGSVAMVTRPLLRRSS